MDGSRHTEEMIRAWRLTLADYSPILLKRTTHRCQTLNMLVYPDLCQTRQRSRTEYMRSVLKSCLSPSQRQRGILALAMTAVRACNSLEHPLSPPVSLCSLRRSLKTMHRATWTLTSPKLCPL